MMTAKRKLPLACRLFGHVKSPPGWWGDIPYVTIRPGPTDGIGRIHGTLHHECHRCGEKFMIGRIHLNDKVIVDALARHERERTAA